MQQEQNLVECPYNSNHKMQSSRLIFHIAKECKDMKAKRHLFEHCPYNFLHIIPKPDLQKHLNECPDYCFNQWESAYYESVTEQKQPTLQQEYVGDENWGKSIEKKEETEQLTVKNDELMKELAQLSDGRTEEGYLGLDLGIVRIQQQQYLITMNADDIRNNLKELQKKQKDDQKKRRTIIKEMRNMPYTRPNFKKIKLENGNVVEKEISINLEGAKEERAEKQKQLDQQVPSQIKERDRRIIGASFVSHLQRAKKLLDSQKNILDKQQEINKRLDDKDKRELQDMKEDQDKRKDQLVLQRKQLEKELAADEYKRQTLLLELQIQTMKDYFITKAYPHILWKPVKTNEGMNHLKEFSQQRINEMEKDMKDKLAKAYSQFIDFQQQKFKDNVEQHDHESDPSDTEESQMHPQQVGQE